MKKTYLLLLIFFQATLSLYSLSTNVLNTGDSGADTARQSFIDINTAGNPANDVNFQPGSAGNITLLSDFATLNYNVHLINNTGSSTTFYRSGNMGGPVTALTIGADINDFQVDAGINIYYNITDASSFEGIYIGDHNFTVNNGLNSDITVISTGADVFGIQRVNAGAGPTFVINGGINGNINLSGLSSVYGLGSAEGVVTINGGINGSVETSATGDFAYCFFNTANNADIDIDYINGSLIANAGGSDAFGIYTLRDLTMTDINGQISAVAGNVNALGLCADNDLSMNNMNGTISATAGLAEAYGLYAWDTLTMNNINGQITANAGIGGAYGICSDSDISINDINGTISATAGNLEAYGLYAFNNLTMNNMNGQITTVTGTDDAYGICSDFDMSINDINGNISTSAGHDYAFGVYSWDQMTINNINGNISVNAGNYAALAVCADDSTLTINKINGNISASTGADSAYGVFSYDDLSLNEMNGSISATAGTEFAVGICSERKIYGIDASSPLNINGSINVSAPDHAYGIIAYDRMLLNITGDISATANTSNAYAILSALDDGLVSQAADDIITIGGGATIRGKIDLRGGTDVINLNGSSLIYDDILNIESLSKTGSGIADLRGDTYVSGSGVKIHQGAIAVNGTVNSSSFSVYQNGTLKGSGTINGNVNSLGIIAPGNSVDTLTINGSLTTSGNIEIEVNNTLYDQILVRGNTVANGGSVYFLFPELTYIPEQDIAFISSTSFSGSFDSFEYNHPNLSITGNKGTAYIRRKGYDTRTATYTTSYSSLSAMAMLTEIARNASGNITDLFAILDYMPDDELASFAGQIHSEPYDAFNEILFSQSERIFQSHAKRLRDTYENKSFGLYFNLQNSQDKYDGLNDRSEFENKTTTLILGFDHSVTDRLTLGAALNYFINDIDFSDSLSNEAENENIFLSFYSGYDFDNNYYANLCVNAGFAFNEMKRALYVSGNLLTSTSIPYTLAESFKSDYNSMLFGISVEGGKRFNSTDNILITSFIGLDINTVINDSFHETSSSPLALSVNDDTYTNFCMNLGTAFSYQWTSSRGIKFMPELELKYQRLLNDNDRELVTCLTAYPQNEYASSSGTKNKNLYSADLNLTIQTNEQYYFQFGLRSLLNNEQNSTDLTAAVNVKF